MQNESLVFYDYTIVGAGASGLWMAYALYQQGLLNNKKLCIVENDDNKINDRTWCYWAKEELTPFNLADKNWSHSINNQSLSTNSSIYPYRYYHIRSNNFYQKIKGVLKGCKNIDWNYTAFESFDKDKKIVKTNDSKWLTNLIFLSALPPAEAGNVFSSPQLKHFLNNRKENQILIWQSFVGWRIKSERPIFNPAKMTMMNFKIPQSKYTQFIYELPFSETEALVEVTRFGDEKLTKVEAEEILHDYLKSKGTKFEILETEIGAIPMTTLLDNRRKKIPSNESVIYLGTIAGAIKPTTGYGFKRMSIYANQLALALANSKNLPTMKRVWRFRFYDTLLLQILVSKPEKGKEIFEELFKNQTVPTILKFLDEETSLKEEIMIFYKLPIWLFLKSLVKYFF